MDRHLGVRSRFTCRRGVVLLAMAVLCACAGVRPDVPANAPANAEQREVRVFSAIGMKQAVLALAPKFERETGYKVDPQFDSGGLLQERLARGEQFDVLLAPHRVVEQLEGSGKLSEGTVHDIAASGVGLAVRSDMPAPDISSAAAFRETMLNAKSIACPDPKMGGSSGVHIAKMFERLGIADAVKPKLVFASTPSVPGTLPGDLVASGRAEVALHQIQELVAVRGIHYVGPLPVELQARFVFTCAVPKGALNEAGALAFVKFLRTRSAMALLREAGMDAVEP